MEIIENLGAPPTPQRQGFKEFHLVTCVVLCFVGKQGNQVEGPLDLVTFFLVTFLFL